MYAAPLIGIAPPMPYFCPSHTFVVGTIKSHVSADDDLWVDRIHGEHRETDVAAAVGAAVSTDRWARRAAISTNVRSAGTMRWYLNPRRPAVHGLVEVMVRVAGPQKIEHGVDHA